MARDAVVLGEAVEDSRLKDMAVDCRRLLVGSARVDHASQVLDRGQARGAGSCRDCTQRGSEP